MVFSHVKLFEDCSPTLRITQIFSEPVSVGFKRETCGARGAPAAPRRSRPWTAATDARGPASCHGRRVLLWGEGVLRLDFAASRGGRSAPLTGPAPAAGGFGGARAGPRAYGRGSGRRPTYGGGAARGRPTTGDTGGKGRPPAAGPRGALVACPPWAAWGSPSPPPPTSPAPRLRRSRARPSYLPRPLASEGLGPSVSRRRSLLYLYQQLHPPHAVHDMPLEESVMGLWADRLE